jgi:hypothetical protein
MIKTVPRMGTNPIERTESPLKTGLPVTICKIFTLFEKKVDKSLPFLQYGGRFESRKPKEKE